MQRTKSRDALLEDEKISSKTKKSVPRITSDGMDSETLANTGVSMWVL